MNNENNLPSLVILNTLLIDFYITAKVCAGAFRFAVTIMWAFLRFQPYSFLNRFLIFLDANEATEFAACSIILIKLGLYGDKFKM